MRQMAGQIRHPSLRSTAGSVANVGSGVVPDIAAVADVVRPRDLLRAARVQHLKLDQVDLDDLRVESEVVEALLAKDVAGRMAASRSREDLDPFSVKTAEDCTSSITYSLLT